MGGDGPEQPFGRRCVDAMYAVIDTPVSMFREKFVEGGRGKPYPYYHRVMRRVPTVDQCYTDDAVCIWEADKQVKRDQRVDAAIVEILRKRKNECLLWHGRGEEAKSKCKKTIDDYEDTATNYFVKYGDLGMTLNAKNVLMKQKHRMIWERRHGPVGSGMKETPLAE